MATGMISKVPVKIENPSITQVFASTDSTDDFIIGVNFNDGHTISLNVGKTFLSLWEKDTSGNWSSVWNIVPST